MKTSIMLLGLSAIAGGNAFAQNATCVPNDNEVAVYEHTSSDPRLLGKCVTLKLGEYPDLSTTAVGRGAMSSIKVGKNVYAVVCDQPDYKGACEIHDTDDGDLRDNPTVKNDRASSVKVLNGKVCSPSTGKKVKIKWMNKTNMTIHVNWITFECSEENNLRSIAPGGVYDGDSYVGHVFRVREEGTRKNLGLIYVTQLNAKLDIK